MFRHGHTNGQGHGHSNHSTSMASNADPASKTDLLLFKALANPDVASVPDINIMMNQNANLLRGDNRGRAAATSARSRPQEANVFRSYVQDQMEAIDHNAAAINATAVGTATGAAAVVNNHVNNSSSSLSMLYSSGSSGTDSNSMRMYGNRNHRRDRDQNNRYSKYDHPNSNPLSITELQMLRNDLQGYKNRGYPITIDIATAPAHLLRTELDLIHENESAEHMVNNMKIGIRIVGNGIEWGNRKLLGSMIPLDNWTEKTFQNTPHIYDHSLRRIYNLYMRNSNTNPIAELGITMAMSAGDHVWTNATSGNMNTSTSGVAASNQSNPLQSLFGWFTGRNGSASASASTSASTSTGATTGATFMSGSASASTSNFQPNQNQMPTQHHPPQMAVPPQRQMNSQRPQRMIRPPFTAGPPRADPVSNIPTH